MVRQGLTRAQLIARGVIIPAASRRRSIIEEATLRLLPGERERFEAAALASLAKQGAWGPHPFETDTRAPEERKMRKFALAT